MTALLTASHHPLLPPEEPLQHYFTLCDQYRCQPHPPVVVALKYPGVSYLTLEKSFGTQDLVPLCEILKRNGTITSLDFRRCSIGTPGCYALKSLLEANRSIRQLSLCNNDIGEHGAQALAEGTAPLELAVSLLHDSRSRTECGGCLGWLPRRVPFRA